MGDKTKIEWTDASWNPVVGCRRVSAGCEHCYAERLSATRLSQTPRYKGLAVMKPGGPRWTGEYRYTGERELLRPIRWQRSRKIFVCDMGDLFFEPVPDDVIDSVWASMLICRLMFPAKHTFQVLTKRVHRMVKYVGDLPARAESIGDCAAALMPKRGDAWREQIIKALQPGAPAIDGIWLGASVEDQQSAGRVEHLSRIKAFPTWLSIEPLLESITIEKWLHGSERFIAPRWVVVGGESGPGARPFNVRWARDLVSECKAADVPVFVKQLGSNMRGWCVGHAYVDKPPAEFYCDLGEASEGYCEGNCRMQADRKGGDMAEWPADLRVREFPPDWR